MLVWDACKRNDVDVDGDDSGEGHEDEEGQAVGMEMELQTSSVYLAFPVGIICWGRLQKRMMGMWVEMTVVMKITIAQQMGWRWN